MLAHTRMLKPDQLAENQSHHLQILMLEAMEKWLVIDQDTRFNQTQESQEFQDLRAQESPKSQNLTQDLEEKKPISLSQMIENFYRVNSTTWCTIIWTMRISIREENSISFLMIWIFQILMAGDKKEDRLYLEQDPNHLCSSNKEMEFWTKTRKRRVN